MKEEGEEDDDFFTSEDDGRPNKKMDPARVAHVRVKIFWNLEIGFLSLNFQVLKQSMIIHDYKYDPRKDKWAQLEIKVL